jgi:hypothetical protein
MLIRPCFVFETCKPTHVGAWFQMTAGTPRASQPLEMIEQLLPGKELLHQNENI